MEQADAFRCIAYYFQPWKRIVGAYAFFFYLELGLEIPDGIMGTPIPPETTDSIVLTVSLA